MDWFTAYNGVLVRVGLYLLVFWPTVGYYIYRDATRRNLSSPTVRGIVYGVLGILGLAIYLGRKARNEGNTM
jgi:hypothetical protein